MKSPGVDRPLVLGRMIKLLYSVKSCYKSIVTPVGGSTANTTSKFLKTYIYSTINKSMQLEETLSIHQYLQVWELFNPK